jgi:hypothetical protein
MQAGLNGRKRKVWLTILPALGLALTAITVDSRPAAAQGFSPFFNDGPRAFAPSRTPDRSRAPFNDFFDGPQQQQQQQETARSGGSQEYCVRLCDGRYFPIPKATFVSVSPAKVCSALCPAAKSEVFTGAEPTESVSSDGTRYSSLKNALLYRKKLVAGCSCTGNGPGGLAQIQIDTDPTLRAGDVVVKTDGAAVFNGSSQQIPHRTADFTPITSRTLASTETKRLLTGLRIDQTARTKGPLQSLAPNTADNRTTTATDNRTRRQYQPATPRSYAEQNDFGPRFR